MSAPYGDPAYKAATWLIGYLGRQVGLAGPGTINALANPPAAMIAAVVTPGETTPSYPEPAPPYN